MFEIISTKEFHLSVKLKISKVAILKKMQNILKKKVLCSAEKGSVIWAEPNSFTKQFGRTLVGHYKIYIQQNWLLNETLPGHVGDYNNNHPNLKSTYGFIVNLPKSLTTFGCGSIIFITESSFKRSLLSFSVAVDFRVLIATTVRHSSLPGIFST